MNDHDAVRNYYASFAEREWGRLENPAGGELEWLLTTRRLSRHLPTGSRVLDLGGGPGRYSIWLAQQGHRVVLADLSPDLLALARAKVAEAGVALESIEQIDARDLSRWESGSFDAVLSLGPFYHLSDEVSRRAAARELVRVTRRGGIVFAAFMPRLTFLARTISIADERRHLTDLEWVQSLLERGEFTNDVPSRFNQGYGVNPPDIVAFMETFDIETISLSSLDSVALGTLQESVAAIRADDPDLHAVVIDLLDRVSTDPSILGAATHLLYVGRVS